MLKSWLRNCKSIFDFMKKEIKDTKTEPTRKMLAEQLSSFYGAP